MAGRHVASNVLWNVLGQAAPIVVALASIPILTRSLGTDRFGLLVLGWTFVGYFSVFDLGLAVAMERSLARQLAEGDHTGIHVTIWTTLAIMLALGAVGLSAAWIVAPAIVHTLRGPSALQAEALTTVHLLALSIPLVITSVGLRGVLAAHMKFKVINAVGIPLGTWTYVGPMLALSVSHSLVLIVGCLVVGRLVGFALYLGFCFRLVPSLRSFAFRRSLVRPLLTFGGWLALDDAIDPIVGFIDRFLIASLVSVAAVAFYGVPYQLAAQGWVLASALSGVLFPLLSGVLARDGRQAHIIFRRAARYVLFAMFPVTLLLVGLAQPGLRFWLGPAYAARSTQVLQLFAIGVLVTSIGSIGGTFNGSAGRPDVNAKLGLVKLVLHVVPLWWVVSRYGIVGLAALWLACVSTESVGMVVFALRAQSVQWSRILRRGLQGVPILALLGVAALDLPLGWKIAYLGAALSGTGVVAWRGVLTAGEKRVIHSRLRLSAAPKAWSDS
jgi:O-antigen/teichoic acid export membrane protein